MKWVSDLLSKMFKGHERTANININIILSFVFKGGSVLINLFLVPLTLNYLNSTKYGIWLTVSSIVLWLSFFDIGLGNGMRNKFSEAKALGNLEKAREYVSTAYISVFFISLALALIFSFSFPFIDWLKVFNAPLELKTELNHSVFVIFIFYFFQFVLNLFGTLLTADQKPFVNSFLNFAYTLLSFLVILGLTYTTNGSLFLVSLSMAIIPVLVLTIASIYGFNKQYRYFKPGFKYFNKKILKDIWTLGIGFFLIQISYVAIFSTSNFLTTHFLGPDEVAVYNIIFRYFNTINMVFSIIALPYWSGFTDAYFKNDFAWIRANMVKLVKIILICFILLTVMVIVSPFVYKIWIGEEFQPEIQYSIVMAFYTLIYILITPFIYFLNGINKIYLQMVFTISLAIINLPLSYFLTVTIDLGLVGIMLSPAFCLLPIMLFSIYQYHLLINHRAKGIFNK